MFSWEFPAFPELLEWPHPIFFPHFCPFFGTSGLSPVPGVSWGHRGGTLGSLGSLGSVTFPRAWNGREKPGISGREAENGERWDPKTQNPWKCEGWDQNRNPKLRIFGNVRVGMGMRISRILGNVRVGMGTRIPNSESLGM